MNNLDLSNYKDLYLKTSREYLQNIKTNLLSLNTNPDDKKIIYDTFRLFHSLKGQNFFMGYEKTARFCKLFEDFFHSINEGQKTYKSEYSSLMEEVLKSLENTFTAVEKNNSEIDLSKDLTNFEERLKQLV